MKMKFKNLDDVEKFITENLPGWRYECGKKNYADRIKREGAHGDDYEVILLYSPYGVVPLPFAELWRGYYEFVPEDFTGFCGNYSCRGSLEFAMKH